MKFNAKKREALYLAKIVSNKDSQLKKNMPTLIILIISGAFIYALPYFRNYYYDTFVERFNITNTQMGALGSIYGVTSTVSFCFGGFCADRWPTKNLLSISLISTGLLGFTLLTTPPYEIVFLIHALWGFTCVLTFWNALIITIRSLANSDEQGKAFGFFEGGRGIVNIIQSAFVLGLFGYLSKAKSEQMALNGVIITYSVICILLGIMVFFALGKQANVAKGAGEKKIVDKKVLIKILKMPTTWLSAIIIFTSYAVIISYFYITPYTTSVFGVTTVIAAALGYFSQYCRPIGCFFTGIVADKIGSSKMMAIVYIILIIGLLGVICVPGQPSMIWLLLVFMAAMYASMYGIQSLHYAILEEGDYPLEITGTATAVIMPIGYSSEFIVPIVAGMCLDAWPGAFGYKVFFIILATLCTIGLFSVFAWMHVTKEKRMQMRNSKKIG